jgi:protein-L-isoaspartate(D-aspartate) O-methyltransferase
MPPDLPDRRARLAQLLRTETLSPAVFEAMAAVPREAFVPTDLQPLAYLDGPLPIGDGQTISQPAVVGIMTELCALHPKARVLEVGTGSGYQTAVLAHLAQDVYTVEIRRDLGERAHRILDGLGFTNVHGRIADGHGGWPEEAPFDAILVTAAPPEIPPPLVEQLGVGGRLVVPVGVGVQDLRVGIRTPRGMDWKSVLPVRFVPLIRPPDL